MPELSELKGKYDATLARLADAEETLRAIRHGEVDALVVGAGAGPDQLFTLTNTDQTYRSFVESMSDGAATVSAEGLVLYANQSLATLLGSSCSRIVGRLVYDHVAGSDQSRLAAVIGSEDPRSSVEVALLATGAERAVQVPVLVRASRLVADGRWVTCLTFTDLTRERAAEANLVHLAQHDALTGLPNRTLLTDRIQHALKRRMTERGILALFFCDIDGFKSVNDAYGHRAGDELLCAVADRLRSAVRPQDTVARIGGDEFVVLCESLDDLKDSALVAARLRSAVSAPMAADPFGIEVTVSIGVAMASQTEKANPDTLLRDADEAMYKAKRQGPNMIEMFDDRLRRVAASRLVLLADLRRAVSCHEFRLVYQPVVRLEDDRVAGTEALIRWQHPMRGLVSPQEFIPFAEKSGLIIQIGAWVLREACLQTAVWAQAESVDPPLTVSVNVSGRQLASGAGLVQTVEGALEDSGLDPESLMLEVTESALMEDAEAALQVVNNLKDLGVQIAIDDFGTGYSSLLYLKRFPVDLLKIDRSFVSGLGVNNDDSAIVRSVIDLARAFDIIVVAEGIETLDQQGALKQLGCDLGQGYLWSPGRPADEILPWLDATNRRPARGGGHVAPEVSNV